MFYYKFQVIEYFDDEVVHYCMATVLYSLERGFMYYFVLYNFCFDSSDNASQS